MSNFKYKPTMDTKEKVLVALKALGFKTDKLETVAYGFHYEGKAFLFLPNEEDEEFLMITLPCVDLDDMDEQTLTKVADRMNACQKYIKTYTARGALEISYERQLLGDEDLEKVIRNMLRSLEEGHFFLYHRLLRSDDGGDNEDSGNTDASDTAEHSEEEKA